MVFCNEKLIKFVLELFTGNDTFTSGQSFKKAEKVQLVGF